MTLAPKSLGGRLLLGSAAFTLLALLFALALMHVVLHRFVTGQIDQRLDNKIVALISQTRAGPDGAIRLEGDGDGPPFDRPEHGAFWQVVGPRNVLRSRWLGQYVESWPKPDPPPPGPKGHPVSLDTVGPDGARAHLRIKRTLAGLTPVTVIAASPVAAIDGPMREALATIGLAMAGLAVALIAATLLQVRLGLRPLTRLRGQITDIRAGRVARIPLDQPREVMPLVAEMNSLLDQNAATLARARRHVANLAHGLKTPLATLSLTLDRLDGDERETPRALVALIDRRIRHHLGRARAAALDGPARSRTPLAERLRDLTDVMVKLHAAKGLNSVLDCPADLTLACETQDVDEILGNLLDNAFKWARSAVSCRAEAVGGTAVIVIADDGPGLAPDEIERVLEPGQRLDDQVPGFGFGLPIARELTELYAGRLDFSAGDSGLRVTVTLPRAM